MVTGDSQEEVLIFRDKQTELHHNIYINIVAIGVIVIMITTPTSAIKSIDDYATLAIPRNHSSVSL